MPARTKARPRTEKRAEEIYRAAARIFYQKGYAATSMGELAKSLSLTKAGLYHYISSKEDLLYRINDLGMKWVESQIMAPGQSIADARQRLEFIVDTHARRLLEVSQAYQILSDEDASLLPRRRREIKARKQAYVDFVRGTMDELKRSGQLADVDTTVATYCFLGAIVFIPRWHEPETPKAATAALAKIRSVILGGLFHAR